VIGISDCAVITDPAASLLTYALGSCIAVAVHDRQAGVAGMLHFMLPESSMNPLRASANPWMFADTGIEDLLRKVNQAGASKKRLAVYILGGARMVNTSEEMNIGKRNHLAARKILWREGVMVMGENVGGTIPRTVRLENATGRVFWHGPGESEKELTLKRKRSQVDGISCIDRG
jgi:chemotaxis protein CheD